MIPYEWNGHIYHGIKAVAQAAGVCPTTVSCHLLRHGHLDNLGIGRGKRAPRNMVWHDKTYPSVKSVAEAAGVSQGYVYRLLSVHGSLECLVDRRRSGKSPQSGMPTTRHTTSPSTAHQEGATV
ncbi:hypothetical protein [Paracoccus yeei]|uniref:hypothetical protein n=1 Tax=Paracoccus yeei TaxID=147645 RepID=UPI00174B19C9|nr:hypothetical protein [Paracoccus yeei]